MAGFYFDVQLMSKTLRILQGVTVKNLIDFEIISYRFGEFKWISKEFGKEFIRFQKISYQFSKSC